MVRRWIGSMAVASTVLAAIGIFAAAKAGASEMMYRHGGNDCWSRYWTDWHRNNNWPKPFVYPDRNSVSTFFEAQIAKGWQRQNLFGEPHFEPDNSKLSPAGIAKMRWILTQNPVEQRTLYVERGWTDAATAKRLAAAQQAVTNAAIGMGDVVVSDMRIIGEQADYVNTVNTKYIQDIPDPKLPPPQTIDTGSSQ